MRSSGFGLGKKQSRGEEPKRQPPTSTDLTQLLSSSQKNPDKSFTVTWQVPNKPNCLYSLSVTNCGSAQRDRRGWSSSAIDNSAIGEAEWKLFQDTDSLRSEIFSMRTSDAYLVHTMLDEASAAGGGTPKGPVTNMPASVAPSPYSDSEQEYAQGGSYETQQQQQPQAASGVQEGSLRMIKIRALLLTFNQKHATGRLICDVGTVQAEVFLTAGEPVHAKSSHSISQGRDLVGDAALIDLLTWNDGTYKFQEGWPAASKTIHHPLQSFFDGLVVPQAAPVAPPVGAPIMGSASQAVASAAPPEVLPQAYSAPPQQAAAPRRDIVAGSPDDFSRVDDLIGDVYIGLVESSGLLKYGMFLMLVRSEFVRHEKGKQPFTFASIELELPPGAQLTDAALGKIGERFEKLCLPLDTLTYAGQGRFYALFPQQESIPVSTQIKQFMNNVQAIPLDAGLHGSAIKVTAGLSEIPRDGADFERIFNHANGLRGQATQAKKIVSSSF